MKIRLYLLLFLLIISGSVVKSQCLAEITTDPLNGSQNLSVQFYGNGVLTEGGAEYDCDALPLPGGWTSTTFSVGSPCQTPVSYPPPDASDYLWTGARDVSGSRWIESEAMNLTGGGTIGFEIRYGVEPLANPTSDCKGPNASNQGVALEYSVSGGPWIRITYYNPLGVDTVFTDWNYFEYTIPLGAQAADTKVRWYQNSASTDLTDNWGVNNIAIATNATVNTYAWDFGDGSPVDNNKDPLHVFPDYGAYNVSLTITTSQPCSNQKDTVLYINSPPTIDNIVEINVNSTDTSTDIPLTGITDGGIGGQTLSLSAESSNPSSLQITGVNYTSPQTTATITVAPDSMMCGDATITASVEYTNLQTIEYDELFTVHVLDKTLPVISCPSDIITDILPGKCDTLISYATPVGTDNCPGSSVVQVSGLPSGSAFPTGTTINEFVITDASGNETRCAFTITVTESIPPTITCPADIVAAECNNTLSIPAAVGADACGVESIIHNSPYGVSYEDASGTYPVGVTIIEWTVTDLSGNTATCDQRVEITPNPPQPTAPDIYVSYGETALLTATPDADHIIRWRENADLSDPPVESSALDLGFLTPETYYRYASQISAITGCEGMARQVAAIVDKAVLTVTAEDATITYGDAIPVIPFSYTGFVFGEDETVINEDPEISINADETSDAGTYPIGFIGGYDNNYSFNFVEGTLTIEKADQTISLEDIPDNLRVSEEHTLVSTATSGLPVIFTFSDPTIASVSGNLMTITKEGTVSLMANNDGGTNYNPAPEVMQEFSTLPSFDNSKSLFTPNSDGINDYWHLPFIDLLGEVSVKVYNRQGKLVYDSKSYANDWDGTYNGNPLPEGAYYYIIDSETGGLIKGVVNIVR